MSDFALELRQLALPFSGYMPPMDGASFLYSWKDRGEEGKGVFGTANLPSKPGLSPR